MTSVRLTENMTSSRALISNPTEILSERLIKSITFAAATTGDVATHDLLTVTGTVALTIFGVCRTNLAGATATIKVGTTIDDDAFIAQTTATDIDANEIWLSATVNNSALETSNLKRFIVTEDVKYTVAIAAISAGVIDFICLWTPISADGKVEWA